MTSTLGSAPAPSAASISESDAQSKPAPAACSVEMMRGSGLHLTAHENGATRACQCQCHPTCVHVTETRRTCVKRADAWQQLDPAVVLALDMAQVDDREGGVRTTHDRLHHLAVNTGRASGVGVNRAILPLQSSHVRARRWASTGAAGTRAGGVLYLSRHAAGGEGGGWVGGKGWGCRERVSGCDRSMAQKGAQSRRRSSKF